MRGAVCTTLLLLSCVAAAKHKKPHIVVLVADDLGYHDMGYCGTKIHTPQLDTLQADPMTTTLDRHYVQKACTPTRATLMTGRWPFRYGLQPPFSTATPYGLDQAETTIADHLKANGYATHAVGKWHLGFCKWQFTPTFRGFSSFYGYYGPDEDYYKHTVRGNYTGPSVIAYDFHDDRRSNCGKGCSRVADEAKGHYSAFIFASRAEEIIAAHDPSTPLFLYLPFQNVHAPAQAPESFIQPYRTTLPNKKRQVFAGMLSVLDEAVGNVTKALKARGLWNDTVFLYTTDNGGPIPSAGGSGDAIGSTNYPLRGGKHSNFEGGLRGRAFVRFPGSVRTPATPTFYNGSVDAADWFPTLSSIVGAPLTPSSGLPLDGINMASALLHNTPSPRENGEVATFHDMQPNYNHLVTGAVRVGPHKLIIGHFGPNGWAPESYPAKGWTPPSPISDGTQLLFNVFDDPHERNPLELPEVKKKLYALLLQVNATKHVPHRWGPSAEPVDGNWLPWLN